MTAESLAQALEARRVGSQWMARCPAHDDRNPSLSVREVDGKVLVCCHAGCDQRAVIDALKALGLWESRERELSFNERIACTYPYTDEHGAILYEVVRLHSPKSFRQRYSDGRGGWIWKKHPHQVLYHLVEVLENPIIFVVEGEKDVETLRDYGFVATTNAGGAKAPWLPQFTEVLCGREIILIPDNDEPGRQRVIRIARALTGRVAKLVILTLDDPHVTDVSDWFAAGHSEVELLAMLDGEQVSQ
jgi:putative DNA primase/helicase